MLLAAVGAASDPSNGGRQMPSHWGDTALNIVSGSSATGTQVLHAVGAAEAGVIYERVDAHSRSRRIDSTATRSSTSRSAKARRAKASSGRRSTPPAIEAAAGAVPGRRQRLRDLGAGRSPDGRRRHLAARPRVSRPARRLDRRHRFLRQPAARCATPPRYVRARKGPALVHAHVMRPYSHSLSDDEKLYKTPAEREDEARRDPIRRFAEFLLAPTASRPTADLRGDARRDRARGRRGRAGGAQGAEAGEEHRRALGLLARRRSDLGGVRHAGAARRQARHDGRRHQPHAEGRDGAQPAHRRLRRRRRGRQPAATRSPSCPARAASSRSTHGLQRLYGDDRVFNSPIAEASIIGRGVGMATRGLKPVVEIQFFDYIWPAMMQIRDEMSMLRYRSGNHWSCPMVIRVPIGGYLRGGGPYHSQSGESIFAHCPGIRIAYPSNAAGRGRPAAHRDPLRRPGAVPRAQAPLPPDLQQGRRTPAPTS